MSAVLADTLARVHTEEAIGTLVEVMRSRPHLVTTEDGGDIMVEGAKANERIAAAKELLDRGYGKPTQAIISIPAQPKAADVLASMSDADLLAAIGAARIARQRSLPAIESTAAELDELAQ